MFNFVFLIDERRYSAHISNGWIANHNKLRLAQRFHLRINCCRFLPYNFKVEKWRSCSKCVPKVVLSISIIKFMYFISQSMWRLHFNSFYSTAATGFISVQSVWCDFFFSLFNVYFNFWFISLLTCVLTWFIALQ